MEEIKTIILPSGIIYGISEPARHGRTDEELIELVAWEGRNAKPPRYNRTA